MNEVSETGFLQAILETPKDDAPLLIYADWLEEQGEPNSEAKAEFLRLTVAHSARAGKKGERQERRQRLQQLAAVLDTSWLAVVSRLTLENCHEKRAEARSKRVSLPTFRYECQLRWEDLKSTAAHGVRFCDRCQHEVHYCDTIMEARDHAEEGHCVAIDLGIIRRPNDLEPRRLRMGRMTVEAMRRLEEQRLPDPVSVERERKKLAADQASESL